MGTLAIFPWYGGAREFSDGFGAVKSIKNKKWGFIDSNGTYIIEPKYDDATLFLEELAAVKLANQWGYVNMAGEFMIDPQFPQAGRYSQGLAPVIIKGKWGYISNPKAEPRS